MEKQTNTITYSKLEQALTLLEMGWSIIPVGRNKKPLIDWKKYQTEKPTSEEVQGWFGKYPYINLATVTGKISNIIVIDIDPRHEGNDELFKNIETVKVKTGGDGQHIYFQYEEGIENKTAIQPGIDVRGQGGFAIIPPSEHESGKCYEWINDPKNTPILPIPDFVKEWVKASSQTQNTDNIKEIVKGVTEGKRNNSAASIVGKLLAKFPQEEWGSNVWPLLEGWNTQNNPPLPVEELRNVYNSILERELEKPETIKGKLKVNHKEENETGEVIYTSFFLTSNGKIAEEVFDPAKQEPVFAIFDGSNITYEEYIQDTYKTIHPIDEPFITSGKVKLPSKAQDYGTELDLFNEIKIFVHSYVDIPSEWEEWTSHYVLLSWIFDKLPVCPYLCALGPSDCGKTRLVQTVGSICYKPIVASGSITASPVFRLLDRFHGTLIINEFDYLGNYDDEMIVILNNGFEAGLPVWRTEGDKKKEVTSFDVYGPKLFSSRKRRNDWAFESRLLTIPMKSTKRSDIPPFLLPDFYKSASDLRNKLLMFRLKHYNLEVNYHYDRFKGISGRLRQTLLAITAVIKDESFLYKAEEFALKTQKELKAMKGLDLDGIVYQVLCDCWESHDIKPLIKNVAKQVREIAELDKLSSKAVGNIIRDELGFQTCRVHGGNFAAILTEEQLNILKDRYEDEESHSNSQTTSPSSPNSTQAQDQGEVGELGELNQEDRDELEKQVLITLAQSYKEGFIRGYDVAQKVGCPYTWAKQTLENLVQKGKVLQYLDNKDMWAVSVSTREELTAPPPHN